MNRRKGPVLMWIAALLFTGIGIAVTFCPPIGAPLGTGDAGHGIRIFNIREADFHDHYPGRQWTPNGATGRGLDFTVGYEGPAGK